MRCIKPLINVHKDEDFAIEFKRIFKSWKNRKVGVDSKGEGSKLDENPKFMPEIQYKDRRMHCMTLERKPLYDFLLHAELSQSLHANSLLIRKQEGGKAF